MDFSIELDVTVEHAGVLRPVSAGGSAYSHRSAPFVRDARHKQRNQTVSDQSRDGDSESPTEGGVLWRRSLLDGDKVVVADL